MYLLHLLSQIVERDLSSCEQELDVIAASQAARLQFNNAVSRRRRFLGREPISCYPLVGSPSLPATLYRIDVFPDSLFLLRLGVIHNFPRHFRNAAILGQPMTKTYFFVNSVIRTNPCYICLRLVVSSPFCVTKTEQSLN